MKKLLSEPSEWCVRLNQSSFERVDLVNPTEPLISCQWASSLSFSQCSCLCFTHTARYVSHHCCMKQLFKLHIYFPLTHKHNYTDVLCDGVWMLSKHTHTHTHTHTHSSMILVSKLIKTWRWRCCSAFDTQLLQTRRQTASNYISKKMQLINTANKSDYYL